MIFKEDSKRTPLHSPYQQLKTTLNIKGFINEIVTNKVKGSTTFDSKKTPSKGKFVSFEEFKDINSPDEGQIKGDNSLSKIMKSFNDLDINDLDLIKDIYVENCKRSVVTNNSDDKQNHKVLNFNNIKLNMSKSKSIGQSGCSLNFKFNQSTISKVNCSKILVVDSKNVIMNSENYSDRGFKNMGNQKEFKINTKNDFIEKTVSKLPDSIGEHTVSKKTHRSRISRL